MRACASVLSQICLQKVDSIQVLDVSKLLLYEFKGMDGVNKRVPHIDVYLFITLNAYGS